MTDSQQETLRLALVDANVLWKRFVRHTLLNLDNVVCEVRWTWEILRELEGNLRRGQLGRSVPEGLTESQVDGILATLSSRQRRILSDPAKESIAAIGTEYTSDEDDRHLLATCVEHGIPTLITEDKGFDVEACAEGFGIEIITTDEFLLSLWDTKFSGVVTAIAGLLGEFADQYDLARSLFEGCPRFEALVRAQFNLPPLG